MDKVHSSQLTIFMLFACSLHRGGLLKVVVVPVKQLLKSSSKDSEKLSSENPKAIFVGSV